MIELDPTRLEAIAGALREQIPNATPNMAKPMIDAAAELQRLADLVKAVIARQLEQLMKAAEDICQCPDCQARRAAADTPAPGGLN